MDPVPYQVREEDVDEVLSAYDVPEELRAAARSYVMQRVLEVDEIVRTAAETPTDQRWLRRDEVAPVSEPPGGQSPHRRDMAVAAIEDLLLRDGFLQLEVDEPRVFPISTQPDTERDDA